jgi:hypothetical protein
VAASLIAATVLEALGSGIRFATFFVPASLGTLEGANAAAFTTFGWAASAGLTFTLVRRARQAVWIAVGVAILVAMDAPRVFASRLASPGRSRGRSENIPVTASGATLRVFSPSGARNTIGSPTVGPLDPVASCCCALAAGRSGWGRP